MSSKPESIASISEINSVDEEETGFIWQLNSPQPQVIESSFAIGINVSDLPAVNSSSDIFIKPPEILIGEIYDADSEIIASPELPVALSKTIYQKNCPRCGSTNLDRLGLEGSFKKLIRLTSWRKYECLRCGKYFYARKSSK